MMLYLIESIVFFMLGTLLCKVVSGVIRMGGGILKILLVAAFLILLCDLLLK